MTWKEEGTFKAWVLMRLNKDLDELAKRPDAKKKLEYLQTAPKFRGYVSTGNGGGSYVAKDKDLGDAIDGWFADNAAKLGDVAGCLRANSRSHRSTRATRS
jgi:hypothetical protein